MFIRALHYRLRIESDDMVVCLWGQISCIQGVYKMSHRTLGKMLCIIIQYKRHFDLMIAPSFKISSLVTKIKLGQVAVGSNIAQIR